MNCESWLEPKNSRTCRYGLGIDQIARHCGLHLLMDRHLFLDGSLHPLQTDAELVLQQLAHCSYASIAQVIDII